MCLFQAGWDPDQGQSKQIREEQTNPAEPLPKASVDLKTIHVPGEVREGRRGADTQRVSCFYGPRMNVPIQQAFVEGVGYTGLQSPERKKCLAHGHEVGHQEYKCDSKVTNSMGRLCSYPPSFMHLPQKQIHLCKALLSKVDFTEYFVGEQAGELHRILRVDSSCHVVTPSPSLPTDSPQCLQGLWLQ